MTLRVTAHRYIRAEAFPCDAERGGLDPERGISLAELEDAVDRFAALVRAQGGDGTSRVTFARMTLTLDLVAWWEYDPNGETQQ